MISNVLLVNNHKLWRDALRVALAPLDDFKVIGDVATGNEAISFCRAKSPQIVVLDTHLGEGLNGIETTREILRVKPSIKMLLLSVSQEISVVNHALKSGPKGLALKSIGLDGFVNALRVIAAGGTFISPELAGTLSNVVTSGTAPSDLLTRVGECKSRELQIFKLVIEGKSNKEVAIALNLQVATVRTYRKTMMKKLGAKNLAQLIEIGRNTPFLCMERTKQVSV